MKSIKKELFKYIIAVFLKVGAFISFGTTTKLSKKSKKKSTSKMTTNVKEYGPNSISMASSRQTLNPRTMNSI